MPDPPVGSLSYSANPAPAGELVVTATFDEPLVAAPTLVISRPGGGPATVGPMQGEGREWRLAYWVPPAGGLGRLDEPATVTLTGIVDQDGDQAAPLVDRSLLLHAPDALRARASLHDVRFSKHDTPVFMAGEAGDWDSGAVGAGDVLKVGDEYWMYYTGFGAEGQANGIGLAVSRDRTTWLRQPGPVVRPGAAGEWDSGVVIHPTVVRAGDVFHMWFIGMPEAGDRYSYRFGHATSRDGLTWERAQPILEPGPAGSWDEERIGGLDVELLNGEFRMAYTATTLTPEFKRQIGCAVSRDGEAWTKCEANPVFRPEPEVAAFEGNEVEEPELAYFYGTWLMAYSGYGGPQGANFHLGLAYSTGSDRWQRLFHLPLLPWGTGASFDATGAGQPSLLVEGNDLWLWYTGYATEGSAIGLAVATLN